MAAPWVQPKPWQMTLTWVERIVLYGVFTEPIFLFDWARPGVFPHIPIADFSEKEQIEAFLNLQARGYIVAFDEKISRRHKDDPLPIIELTESLIKTQFEIGHEIAEARNIPRRPWHHWIDNSRYQVSYRLTDQGGACMETLTDANWDRFHTYSLAVLEEADLTPDQEHCRGWLKATTLETLENYIDWSLRWENNIAPEGMLTSLDYGRPIPITHWKPLYWKTLSHGFMCSMDELRVHYNRESYSEKECERWNLAWEEECRLFHWYNDPLQEE